MKKTTTLGIALGLIFLFASALHSTAQISPPVKNTTKDHQRQCIGYITQWDAWKGTNNGVLLNSYNHLNIDYSQYTILNFSFFGVAKDGSLHSADLRNKQIYQAGVNQEPAKLLYDDIYSSFDMFFIKGDVQMYYNISPYLKGLGYVDSLGGWYNTKTGEKGTWNPGLVEKKENPAFKSLFAVANEKGVKVMASIGGWSMCKHFGEVAADATKRKKFTDDCKKLIAMGFDGIDIDWEYPGRAGMNFTGTQADFNNYAVLMEDIRATIGPGKLLTGAFHAVVKPKEFDWTRLDKSMDYFNMMTYDLNGGWSNKAGHNSPLFDYPGAEYPGLDLKSTLDSMKKQGVNLKKVNLGAAFYGRGVVCSGTAADLHSPTVKVNVTVQPDGPISTAADYDNFKLDVWDGTPNYSFIVNNATGWTEKWDDIAMVPYRTKGKYFLSYDNVKSIGAKAQFIKDNDLAGIIIWQVYGDLMKLNSCSANGNKFPFCPSTTSPLINEINEVFAGKVIPLSTNNVSNDLAKTIVYPNPSNGKITVNFSGSAGNEILIYNTLGQEVYKTAGESDATTIDLSHLNKGIYLMRISNPEKKTSAKFILE